MGNGVRITGSHARQRLLSGHGFAGRTAVFDLFSVFFRYFGDRLFPERVVFVLSDLKNTERASCHAFFTAITFICIDGDEVFTRAVFITVMGKHFISVLFLFRPAPWRTERLPRLRRSGCHAWVRAPLSLARLRSFSQLPHSWRSHR